MRTEAVSNKLFVLKGQDIRTKSMFDTVSCVLAKVRFRDVSRHSGGEERSVGLTGRYE